MDRGFTANECGRFLATRAEVFSGSSPAVLEEQRAGGATFGRIGLLMAIWAAVLGAGLGNPARADALKRLTETNLKSVHEAVVALRSERQDIPRTGPYKDYRAAIHLHSAFSHDSRGTIDEIAAAAKVTGTEVLMFTEHPSDAYDPAVNGHHGMHDGVLLIPGLEARGFLVFPTESMKGVAGDSPQAYVDESRAKGALVFLSHLEERMDWDVHGLTGTEIYNTHADFLEEKRLIATMKNPLGMFQMIDLFQKYPQEAFGAVQDYPAGYLKKWDELCQKAPCTGIAAPDSHQNVGLRARLLEGNSICLEDALGEKLLDVNLLLLPVLQPLAKGKKAGDVLFQFQMDPYAVSIGHVGTHLLMPELTEKATREALEAGRAYVSFDWIADAKGFDFAAVSKSGRHEMGSQLECADGLKWHAEAPLPVEWRLVRDGKVVSKASGRKFELEAKAPGNYRIEAWLDVAGQEQIWILSNPIYLRATGSK